MMKVVFMFDRTAVYHILSDDATKKEKKMKTAQLIALLCKFPCASDVVVPTLDGELSQYLKLEEHDGQIWLMATTPEQSDNVIFKGESANDGQ